MILWSDATALTGREKDGIIFVIKNEVHICELSRR